MPPPPQRHPHLHLIRELLTVTAWAAPPAGLQARCWPGQRAQSLGQQPSPGPMAASYRLAACRLLSTATAASARAAATAVARSAASVALADRGPEQRGMSAGTDPHFHASKWVLRGWRCPGLLPSLPACCGGRGTGCSLPLWRRGRDAVFPATVNLSSTPNPQACRRWRFAEPSIAGVNNHLRLQWQQEGSRREAGGKQEGSGVQDVGQANG
jgi:hypothetical protein